ncbi:hypothetical protein [Burkholderia cenocepacia]|uniref:hypothetical protein n=1 Tax=Burkholderia cenocepacia TaxID=95486 RepID=UPI0024B807F4|nr:hypothetical protein [Burkholderia cenocepacia]MDI9675690.1 hypothetical protein [Burkholderia cenocepacia]
MLDRKIGSFGRGIEEWQLMASDGEAVRLQAAVLANRQDAEVWRWFCRMYEEGRLMWRVSGIHWFVSVDQKHLATDSDFDGAIRSARQRHEAIRRKSRRMGGKPTTPPERLISIGMGRIKLRA